MPWLLIKSDRPMLIHIIIAMFLRGKTGLCFCLLFTLTYADEGCDKSQCKGPLTYYEVLKCKPVYSKPGDCCAVSYDCSHLEGRAADKCYANGREYAIGEKLKDEDRSNPCDIECKCFRAHDNAVAEFNCAIVDCFNMPVKEGCYLKENPDKCCDDEEVCPKEGEEIVTCEVDGVTYYEGQSFYSEGKPDLSCTCMEGFKGEFVEPFCKKYPCGGELRHSSTFHNKCVPVYYKTESPATSCGITSSRCQNNKDEVIKAVAVKSSTETSVADKTNKSDSDEQPSNLKCTFGNMTMEIGDELNQATSYDSVCVKCVCEVPPTPTCRDLSDTECDRTKHRYFDY